MNHARPASEPDAFAPPRAALVHTLTAPLRRWFAPTFLGLADAEPERPALYVGNHTLYGVLDVPLLFDHLYREHGVYLRSLGDRAHFAVPGWRDFLARCGAVVGAPETCAALMRAGQSILVFPGGAREVFRRKDEQYQLIWKRRTGFARLALAHGYDIIPFCSLGADENYRVLFDSGDLERTPWLRDLAKRTGLLALARNGDAFPPLVAGLGPTFIPRPQRLYFGFGARIPAPLASPDDAEAAWALREQVAAAIEAQRDRLVAFREADRPRWSWLRRRLAPPLGPGPAT